MDGVTCCCPPCLILILVLLPCSDSLNNEREVVMVVWNTVSASIAFIILFIGWLVKVFVLYLLLHILNDIGFFVYSILPFKILHITALVMGSSNFCLVMLSPVRFWFGEEANKLLLSFSVVVSTSLSSLDCLKNVYFPHSFISHLEVTDNKIWCVEFEKVGVQKVTELLHWAFIFITNNIDFCICYHIGCV